MIAPAAATASDAAIIFFFIVILHCGFDFKLNNDASSVEIARLD